MPDNFDEGLLSQEEINQALAAAGIEAEVDSTDDAGTEGSGAADGAASGEPPVNVASAPAAAGPSATPYEIPELGLDEATRQQVQGIDLLRDVELNVKIELGRTRMLVDEVLRLADGAVVELDKLAGDPVDVFVNNRLVARGEVLVLNDNFCVRISDIISKDFEEES